MLGAGIVVHHFTPVQEFVAGGGHQQITLWAAQAHGHVGEVGHVIRSELEPFIAVPGLVSPNLPGQVTAGVAGRIDQTGFELLAGRMRFHEATGIEATQGAADEPGSQAPGADRLDGLERLRHGAPGMNVERGTGVRHALLGQPGVELHGLAGGRRAPKAMQVEDGVWCVGRHVKIKKSNEGNQ